MVIWRGERDDGGLRRTQTETTRVQTERDSTVLS